MTHQKEEEQGSVPVQPQSGPSTDNGQAYDWENLKDRPW